MTCQENIPTYEYARGSPFLYAILGSLCVTYYVRADIARVLQMVTNRRR